MTETYYDRLGVTKAATQEEVEKAWKRSVMEKHPDQNDDPDAQQQFIRFREAYDVLSDPDMREQYDELGHEAFVGGRGHESSDATEDAYQRDRSSQSDDATVNWRAHTRGHEAAEHVWKPGSGPTADTAPPHDTADVDLSKRIAAYGLSFGAPAMLTYILLSWPESSVGQFLFGAGVSAELLIIMILPLTLLAVIASEWLLDTERRLWESISEFTSQAAEQARNGWATVRQAVQ